MRIPTLKQIGALFSSPKSERGFRDVTSVGGVNADWALQSMSEDADVWQNAYALTSRCRDLFKTNPLYIKYRELLWANIFGENGIGLRMKVKETESRIIHTADEKAFLFKHEQRINRVRQWAANKAGTESQAYRAFTLADQLETRALDDVIRGKASIQIGAPDIYANELIERKFTEWQRAEHCDIRGRRSYNSMRQLRLISAVRDGDFFIRKVKDPRVNRFGFAIQLINAEWCDRWLNGKADNGNSIRMGIEYADTPWGMGKPVAFYFIKRQSTDWQFSFAGSMGGHGGMNHDRIPADEIIHYARAVDADSTRPAPWIASTIPKARQLDQYELAEVIAAREQACKTGWLYSDVLPEGGNAGATIDPQSGLPTSALQPGETHALPWGVKYQANNPTHPNGNFETFRKGMMRSMTSGMPGADYNILANDLENINFSAGRLGRLDTNEMSKLIQRFDIETAETPIFEAWLEMALITGAVPLPAIKLEKFNKPHFRGRRWRQVDEAKEAQAAAMRVANKFSTRTREIEDSNSEEDFEEIVFKLAEEEMLLDALGLSIATTADPAPAQAPEKEYTDNDDTETKPKKKPEKVS